MGGKGNINILTKTKKNTKRRRVGGTGAQLGGAQPLGLPGGQERSGVGFAGATSWPGG